MEILKARLLKLKAEKSRELALPKFEISQKRIANCNKCISTIKKWLQSDKNKL